MVGTNIVTALRFHRHYAGIYVLTGSRPARPPAMYTTNSPARRKCPLLCPAVGAHIVFERLERRKQGEIGRKVETRLNASALQRRTRDTDTTIMSALRWNLLRVSRVHVTRAPFFSSPNRTRKSGARFFSTTGITYGDTAVLSALMRLAMTTERQRSCAQASIRFGAPSLPSIRLGARSLVALARRRLRDRQQEASTAPTSQPQRHVEICATGRPEDYLSAH